jgi:EmrB/QacA subfamily drug resistance transporter
MTRYRHLITDQNAKWWTLGAMCFALFMIMLDNTVVNVALPSIQNDLGSSLSSLEWTINGYTLSFGVLLVTGGRLGDIFGRRRAFLVGVMIFAVSSATAGLATGTATLVASRIIQGVGAALMMPATLSIVTNAFEPHERGKAIGTWAGVSALALAIGPVLGGILTEHVSWRAIFYLNIPVAIGAVAATLFAVRESRDESVGRQIDFLGVGTLTAGLTALVLALIEANSWGWGSPAIIALLATSVASTVAFFVIERRVSAPIVELPLFRDRNFVGSNLIALVVTFAMLSQFFFVTLYIQDVLGYSPVEAGLRFLPATLMIVLFAPIAGRLTDRVGPRWLIGFGLVLVAISLYWLTTIGVGTGYGDIWPSFTLMGLGMALVMSPMSTAAMNAVPVAKAGVASGILSMNRMVGGTLGIAVVGAVFAGQAPAGARDPAACVGAFSTAMWVATAVAALGAVLAIALLRGKAEPAGVGPGEVEAAAAARGDLATGELRTVEAA